VSKYAREIAEFLNLYSKWRGTNRFPGLVQTLDWLALRPEVRRRGFRVPKVDGLRRWVERETRLANTALKHEVERAADPDLAHALEWSEAVNRSIGEIVRNVPPFPLVRESLEAMVARADIMVVSATPTEALQREWREHDLAAYVGLIAGQEMGSKKEHLAIAAPPQKYARDHVLMIGDAPGDLAAANANGVLFYPIMPGDEETSWRRLYDEALPRFFALTYAGAYMQALVDAFDRHLTDSPPWATQ
jgi:phosphoglycolate phosphatase-like HAD superfamily hydrolase